MFGPKNARWALTLAASLLVAGGCSGGDETEETDAGSDVQTDNGGTDGTDTPDPCAGLELCAAEGSACDGNGFVTCAPNADGCLVETVTACAAGQVCDDAGAEPACVAACEDECDAPGGACEDGVAVMCEVGSDGCLVETRDVCGDGEVCSEGDGIAVCAPDVCEGRALCADIGAACDGDVVATCAIDADGCLVETRLDCALTGEICGVDDGGVPTCGPVCVDDAGCSEAGSSCSDDTLVVCEVSDLGCLVRAEFDCTAGREGGFCSSEGVATCAVDGDPCDGIEQCVPSSVGACDGDTNVTCVPDAFGCNVEQSEDCAAVDGGYCGPGGCAVVDPDVCAAIPAEELCDEAGAVCTETGTEVCARNADGCLVLTTETCGEGTTCVDGACVDICSTRTTCESEFYCDGDDAVACAEDADGCLVESGRDGCLFGCGGAGVCAPDPCIADGCDPELFAGSCADTVLTLCDFDEALGCFVISEFDCSGIDELCMDDTDFATCAPAPCGDGFWDAETEGCDDENIVDGDGCSATCTVEAGWDCVGEFTFFGVVSVCSEVDCGDGIITSDEQCDDGNDVDADGCTACMRDETFSCIGEPSFCEAAVCGNETTEIWESCDDGATEPFDGCSAECGIEISPIAGAQFVYETTIDDGLPLWFRLDADCSGANRPRDSYFEPVAITNSNDFPIDIAVYVEWTGDGFVHLLDSSAPSGDFASACVAGDDDFDSTLDSLIEAATIPAGETWYVFLSTFDAGDTIEAARLTVTTLGCGDGILAAGEECDDGANDDGDGCSAGCLVESGFFCAGEPSECAEIVCGDEVIAHGETCDDGNDFSEDGCSSSCTIEEGYQCFATPSICELVTCGDDDITQPFESCEDGNTDGGDGCSAACIAEAPSPGDEAVVFTDSLTDGNPSFFRPGSFCAVGDRETYFGVYPITNATDGTLFVDITAAWADGDGFLVVYDGSFDPSDGGIGCLDANDDFGGTSGSALLGFPIAAGATLQIVPTTYAEFDTISSFELTVSATPAE
ncbi:MAG: DUF4215 domain-containing protein [Myxococcales bacterium]|nr:DUF4215 domain-containing protein [Myxococcales bacterium]